MKNRNLIISLDKSLSEPVVLSCGVIEGAILSPAIVLLCVNDMKLAVKECDLRLYANDTFLIFNNEKDSSIKKHLNVDFNSLSEWFIDNKLSIHLGKDKTKCILFKKGKKQYPTLKITTSESNRKHYSVVEYLGSLLDENVWTIHGKKGIKN